MPSRHTKKSQTNSHITGAVRITNEALRDWGRAPESVSNKFPEDAGAAGLTETTDLWELATRPQLPVTLLRNSPLSTSSRSSKAKLASSSPALSLALNCGTMQHAGLGKATCNDQKPKPPSKWSAGEEAHPRMQCLASHSSDGSCILKVAEERLS